MPSDVRVRWEAIAPRALPLPGPLRLIGDELSVALACCTFYGVLNKGYHTVCPLVFWSS